MDYSQLIEQFAYELTPSAVEVCREAKLEAVAKEVLGTKQRRLGPLPSVETQYGIRTVIRESGTLQFMVPWAASKQESWAGLDILEYLALKQLVCLQDGLKRYGVESQFRFRVDDLSDRYLFGESWRPNIAAYSTGFTALANKLLDGVSIFRESDAAEFVRFSTLADQFVPIFYGYLTDQTSVLALAAIGWKGEIPQVQRDYYKEVYARFYPNIDPNQMMARYFAATLARVQLELTGVPQEPHISIAFYSPVPGNPIPRSRVHYRTLPERFTHTHRPPWNARGYFEIDEQNVCTPKYVNHGERIELIPNTLKVGGVTIDAPYRLV